MLKVGKDELICDLAETYGILDFNGLSPWLVATLAVGLNDNSRIKKLLSGQKYTIDQMFMMLAIDNLNFLSWTKTKDATKGRGKPKSIYKQLVEKQEKDELLSFSSPEEFEQYMQRFDA